MNRERNKFQSMQVISYYTGYIILVVATLMLIPIITSICFREWKSVIDFLISGSISYSLGMLMVMFGIRVKREKYSIQWKHGFVIASLSWILLMVLCAIPYVLSGHTASLLDGCFDVFGECPE